MIKRPTKVIFIKNKKLFNLYDLDVNNILVSKKQSYCTKNHLNTSLDIMMMLFDHFV